MRWWARLWHRTRMEEQLEKELRFHLEERENALIERGYSPAEARREAQLALGGPEQVKEKCRDARATRWLEELLQDTSYALRTFRQRPGFAAITLLILNLTRAISRERELAMRAALGARRGRLVRQCMTESAVLGLCGGLLGVIAATVSVHPFVTLWPGNLPRSEEIHIDWRVLCFAAGMSLFSGLLFGLTPALRVPIHRLEEALRAGGRTMTGNSRRLHGPFVISEIALAFLLLVSAGMLGKTLLALSSLNPGFNPHNVLTARFALSPKGLDNPAQIRSAWQDVLDRARRVPHVKFAALADVIPMGEGQDVGPYRTTPNPLPPNEEPFALMSFVTPDYLKVMRIPLLEGRFFNEHDRDGSRPVVVVDEDLARHAFGRKNVVGQHIWMFSAAPIEIVGVVGHVRHWGLARDDQSRVRDQLYSPFAQVPAGYLHLFSSFMSIALRTDEPARFQRGEDSGEQTSPLNLVKPLQQELRGADGDQTLYQARTMDELVSASLDRQRFLSLLFGIFAVLASLLACTGIYGVLAYLTGQRVPEIGVRMALGASVGDILRLVLWQSLKMILVGVGIGIATAVEAGRVLQHLVEGMQPITGATFAIMVPLLMAAALLASFIPARRASLINPVRALRQE